MENSIPFHFLAAIILHPQRDFPCHRIFSPGSRRSDSLSRSSRVNKSCMSVIPVFISAGKPDYTFFHGKGRLCFMADKPRHGAFSFYFPQNRIVLHRYAPVKKELPEYLRRPGRQRMLKRI